MRALEEFGDLPVELDYLSRSTASDARCEAHTVRIALTYSRAMANP
jgi:hypothetical protein